MKKKVKRRVLSGMFALLLIIQMAFTNSHQIIAQQPESTVTESVSSPEETEEQTTTENSEQTEFRRESATGTQSESATGSERETTMETETEYVRRSGTESESESEPEELLTEESESAARPNIKTRDLKTVEYMGMLFSYDPATGTAAVEEALDFTGKDVVEIPDWFRFQNINYKVTQIKESAFDMDLRDEKAKLSGKKLIIPDTVVEIGTKAFIQRRNPPIGEIVYKKVVNVDGELPNLQTTPAFSVPEEVKQYEDWVDSSQGTMVLSKAAKWTDEVLNKAEIRIDYAKYPNYKSKLDFVIVMDQSSSMQDQIPYTAQDGVTYKYQRFMYQDDIVQDISKLLLENQPPGYDNRVALVGFGGKGINTTGYPLIWSSNFTSSTSEVNRQIYTHPTSNSQNTHYGQALDEARKVINARPDKSRTPVVIFLSDGVPYDFHTMPNDPTAPVEFTEGIEAAEALRQDKVRVYPIGVFIDPNNSNAQNAMKAISHNKNTYYDAANVNSFTEIMKDVIEQIITKSPMDLTITDVVADPYELATGNVSQDITISQGGGSASISGDRVIWDLNGCDPDKLHNIRIKVKVKPTKQLSTTGSHPTNTSLVTSDGTVTARQPALKRYLVHHVFRNGTNPGQPLPQEITDVLTALPPVKGGFRNAAAVTPTTPGTNEVTTAAGEIWKFDGWDKDTDTINNKDVTFTGTWKRTGVDFKFTKTNSSGEKLSGAAFDLYQWKGGSAPAGADQYITPDNTGSTKWQKIGALPESPAGVFGYRFTDPGTYQLIETAAPAGYSLPDVQWRLIIDNSFILQNITTIKKSGVSLIITDFNNTGSGESNKWNLVNIRKTFVEVKKTISNYGQQTEPAKAELDRRPFMIRLSGAVSGGVTLKHGETSKKMAVPVGHTPVKLKISEIMPMEFDQQYGIMTLITHADGSTEEKYDREITVREGDVISITVINKFTPVPFFKGWDSISNIFEG